MATIEKKVILTSGEVNENGRYYTSEVLHRAVEQFKSQPSNTMFGQVGYPDDPIVSLANVSHKINKLYIEKSRLPRKKKKVFKKSGLYKSWKLKSKKLIGELELLDTPQGKKIVGHFHMFEAGSRGFGTIGEDGKVENFELISVDLIPQTATK